MTRISKKLENILSKLNAEGYECFTDDIDKKIIKYNFKREDYKISKGSLENLMNKTQPRYNDEVLWVKSPVEGISLKAIIAVSLATVNAKNYHYYLNSAFVSGAMRSIIYFLSKGDLKPAAIKSYATLINLSR
jgi:hypothetical protein